MSFCVCSFKMILFFCLRDDPKRFKSDFLWPKVMQWLFLKNSQEIQIFSDKSTFWRHRRCRKVKVGFSGRSGLLFCSFFPFWKLELAFCGRKLLKLMWFNHKTPRMLRANWETLITTTSLSQPMRAFFRSRGRILGESRFRDRQKVVIVDIYGRNQHSVVDNKQT